MNTVAGGAEFFNNFSGYRAIKAFALCRFGDFDVNEYKTTIWYVYNGNNSALSLIYVIFGVALPIFMKYIVIDKFRIPSI